MVAHRCNRYSRSTRAPQPRNKDRSLIVGGGEDAQTGRQYDVAPDGRFLINTVLESAPVPITLVMNWNGAVKK